MDKEFKDLVDEFEYGRGVLESLLYYGSKDNNFKLPTIEEFILSEVTNGTIDYLTGNGGKVTFKEYERPLPGKGIFYFVHSLLKYFKEEIESSNKKIDPKVKNAIIKMVQYREVSPYPDDSYPNTDLYDYFNGPRGTGFCDVYMKSIFSLSYELVNNIENKFLPLLSKPEKGDIEGIGKCMIKYIDEDLEYIKKTYWW